MPDSEEIINWPLRSSSTATAETKEVRATHPQTPYQSHNGYAEYMVHKRLMTALLGVGCALFSDIVSITLYVLVGLQSHECEWLFRTWIVVSTGCTVLFGILAACFYRNYRKAKRATAGEDGEKGTPLKAIGRKEIDRESHSMARAPLVRTRKEEQELTSPITVVHQPRMPSEILELRTSNSSRTIRNAINALHGQSVAPNHLLSPPDTKAAQSCECSNCAPPPQFPSPAKLSDQTNPASEDPFYRAVDERQRSPVSPLTAAEEASIRRSDSLKKLREATLRRKQAFEVLK